MIRDEYAVDAVFDAEPRVLASINPLDEESSRPRFADAVHESPIHGRILPERSGHIDAVVHGVLLHGLSGLAFVAGGALGQVLGPSAQISFAVAARGVVAGERDHLTAGRFHAPQDFFAGVKGTRRIQLIPHGASEFSIDV